MEPIEPFLRFKLELFLLSSCLVLIGGRTLRDRTFRLDYFWFIWLYDPLGLYAPLGISFLDLRAASATSSYALILLFSFY